MKAPVGSLVKLYYDAPDIVVRVGDVLQTRTGRCYMLISVRQQQKGAHVGRWNLKTVVIDKVPPEANIHPIFWYRR
jgi:hypothetical protein